MCVWKDIDDVCVCVSVCMCMCVYGGEGERGIYERCVSCIG